MTSDTIVIGMDKDFLICPITHQIFRNPVIASDGHAYEYCAIKQCIEISQKSPLTNIPINKEMYPAFIIKNMVDKLLEEYPELKEDQFEEHFDERKLYQLIKDNNVKDAITYLSIREISFLTYRWDINILLQNDEIAKIILDKNIVLKNVNGLLMIHAICIYASQRIIKYAIDTYIANNFDLNIADINGWYPIHYICASRPISSTITGSITDSITTSSPTEIIKTNNSAIISYIIDKYIEHNIDLECKTNKGITPIHIICTDLPTEILEYVISKFFENNINIEQKTDSGCTPLHLICERHPLLVQYTINHYIEKNITIESECITKWKPIHFICKHSTPENMKYILRIYLEQNISLESTINNGWTILHLVGAYHPQLFIYVLDKYFNQNKKNTLEKQTDDGSTPVHVICKSYARNTSLIKKIIKMCFENNFNFELTTTKEKWQIIHVLCMYGKYDIVKYIIKNYITHNILINSNTLGDYKIIHHICVHGSEKSIKYVIDIYIKLHLSLECEAIHQIRPIHAICMRSSPSILKYLLNKKIDIHTGTCITKLNEIPGIYTLTDIINKRYEDDETKISIRDKKHFLKLIDNFR